MKEVTNVCHPELDSGSRCSIKQEEALNKNDFRATLCSGFTLIEVLVVVLIIGVLAAVALPQYQKAVLKSRYSAMMPITKALAEGNEIYYMEHGNYSEEPTELPVQGKAEYPDGTEVLIYSEDDLSYVRTTNDSVPNARYLVYQKHSGNFAGTTMCEAGDDRAKALCQALGGEEVPGGNSSGESNWTAYLLSGGYGSTDTFAGGGEENDEETDTPTQSSTPPCNEADKPADVTASQSNATGTATCVNGQWKYQWTSGMEYSATVSYCRTSDEYGCAGSTFSGLSSHCNITTGYHNEATSACAGSTFSGKSSHCTAESVFGCKDSTFSGESSYCDGLKEYGCAGSTFSGSRSYCDGRYEKACVDTIIQGNAVCNAKVLGACDGAKYGEDPTGTRSDIGACVGTYCPDGSLIGTHRSEPRSTFAWKGGYCDPGLMISGKCPSGSPKQGGGCWDGEGNETTCLNE